MLNDLDEERGERKKGNSGLFIYLFIFRTNQKTPLDLP